jgi:hypothetical protein
MHYIKDEKRKEKRKYDGGEEHKSTDLHIQIITMS